MSASRLRLLSAAVALGIAGALAITAPASAAVGRPPPSPPNEGPAGPPALMPDGRVAVPPRVAAPVVSTNCPAAPSGVFSAAPGTGKTVALTFDDGPGPSTSSILAILETYGAAATFFNIGQNAAARPSLVRREAREGYMSGNHTWDHPDMTTLSASAQATEMDRASTEQKTLTGTLPCAFRPPGGSYNSTTESLAQQRRMKFWTWSVDTEDWKAEGSGSSYWVNRIVSLAESEGRVLNHPVVLMHNQPVGNPATVSALPTIIKFFRDKGYTFVDLSGGTRWSTRTASQATAQTSGAIDVSYKAADTTMGHTWYAGGWKGPVSMGAEAVTGEPSVVTSTPSVVDAFWQGSDGGLWHQYTTSGGWSAQRPMNMGTLGGPPKAMAQPNGNEDVFWRGTDNHLWHAYYTPGSGWHGAQNLGGALASDPAPAASNPGNVDVFWQGADGGLWHVYNNGGSGWSAPAALNMGALGSGPAATGQLSGAVDVFWRGSGGNNQLWHAYYVPGSGWHGAQNLGGALPASTDPVAPVTSNPGNVDVFWRGADGGLWHVYNNGGSGWSASAALNMGALGSMPFATGQPNGTVDVFWRGSGDDHLWHAYYHPGHGWAGAQNLGGNLAPMP
ncbi:MAG TPA: polysaccharide deacetylase family protein [Streptosporangiaceae bacterium]|nr:polysaccharide deacetylase family protein [Streptosporangiaceae bacterium]